MDLWIKINRSLAIKKMQTEGKIHPKGVKKIAKELDKAVAMHKSQAKRLRKAGISEEISRRNKPSALKKKAKLDVALKKLKARKEKHQCSCSEGNARYDKLVKAIKNSQLKDVKQFNKLTDVAKKVKNIPEQKIKSIREMVSKMRASDYRSPGKTYDIPAKEVKNNQLAKREPDKGSTLATRGTKNTEVKDKRKPAPYSTKKKEKSNFKGPSKERIGNIAKGVHSAVKSAGSALQSGYGQSSWK